jgi:hypothetical protein
LPGEVCAAVPPCGSALGLGSLWVWSVWKARPLPESAARRPQKIPYRVWKGNALGTG